MVADNLGDLFGIGSLAIVAVFTSELALAETLAKPFETGRDDIARVYEEMLSSSSWLSVLSVERTILIEAARLQARLALRLPDAIHVATAAAAACDVLLSNDRRLKVPGGMVLRRLK
jgi:predicted nucleic acid-binding protein